MEYYYTPKEYISPGSLTIVDDEAKHLGRVLRKKSGEEIFVTDGEGNLYKTKISGISKELIECNIIDKFFNLNEPEIKITLYPALIKNPARFEFIIEKAVELGVYEIQPVITENVVNKPSDKTERWQQIALSAMKQSQRCYLPKVSTPASFAEAVSGARSDIKVIADERNFEESAHIKSICAGLESALPVVGVVTNNEADVGHKTNIGETIDLFIGPEGGFTKEEIDSALLNNFKILNLGARKYRSETAAILSIGFLLNFDKR